MPRDYVALVTSEHRLRPQFAASVQLLAGAFGGVTSAIAALPENFDLDLAQGKQLDAVGAWVGVSRYLKVSVAGLLYFTWDDPAKGWDTGYWKPPYAAGTDTATLDDISFRAAIRLRILGNTWDGTTGAWQARQILLENAAPNLITYVDNLNTTLSVYISGPPVSTFLRTVINQAELLPRPAGMSISAINYV